MQILMSQAAHDRVAARLAAAHPDLEVVTLDPGGVYRRDRRAVPVDEVDPEVVWVSLDLYYTGQMALVFRHIQQGANARWAQLFVAGLDNPAFTAFMAKGVRLTKSSAQAPAIAEYVLCHSLARLHPIADQRRAQDAYAWIPAPFREIGASRWLIVGFGSIGREIGRRLQPFGAHVTAVRRDPTPEPFATEVRSTADLPTLLPNADVVVLACALNEETRGLAGAAFFQAIKPGSLLLNIARGAVVDEAALRDGLDRDQPAHAVLDVFDTEPLPPNSWFWDHPKVTVTAHASSFGDGVQTRGDALFLENLRRYGVGEPLLNEARRSEVGL